MSQPIVAILIQTTTSSHILGCFCTILKSLQQTARWGTFFPVQVIDGHRIDSYRAVVCSCSESESLLLQHNLISELGLQEHDLDSYQLKTFRAVQDVMAPARASDQTALTTNYSLNIFSTWSYKLLIQGVHPKCPLILQVSKELPNSFRGFSPCVPSLWAYSEAKHGGGRENVAEQCSVWGEMKQ